jgi:carnitine-CoA ligase
MTGPVTPLGGPGGLRPGTGAGLGEVALRLPYGRRTLLHVLDRHAEQRPGHAWAIFDGDRELTFAGARDAAFRFAAATAELRSGSPHVALLLRNQHEFLPAFFGAQAAGGLPIPLNPDLRGPLLETMLRRCEADLLVVRGDLLDTLAEAPGTAGVRLLVVCGDAGGRTSVHGVPIVPFDDWCAQHRPRPPKRMPRPDELAALMFTSGTSGGSKAAMWPHHYLYLSSAGVCDALGHTADDALSSPLQMCHIAGLQTIANAALQVGCTAHLKSTFSASRWWDEIARDGATFAMLMGQMAAMILEAVPGPPPPHRMSHVYILPQPPRREEFERRYGTTVIWQGWGMTEIFPHLPTKGRIENVPADTIGHPPGWVEYGIVDEHDRMQASDVLGEMVYRPLIPHAMASGYYGDPEATDRAFRNGFFHTGDLGYYDDQGRIHFVMRNQDAIRRRGENISAVELENVARSHSQVLDAAAYAVPSEFGEHEVKLDLVCGRPSPAPADLHKWLTEQLPRYMVPRYLELLDAFPRTVSQRVEKYKLAARALDRAEVHEFAPQRRR